MKINIKRFWQVLIETWGITPEGKITRGIFEGRTMKEVYHYFAYKSWDYPSMILFFESDTETDVCEEMSMHPEANEYELAWGCNMEFDT